MCLTHRIARLEDRTNVGFDRNGHCRFAKGGRRNWAGKWWCEGQTTRSRNRRLGSGRSGLTPCPRCGRDLTTYITINSVSRLTPEAQARAAALEAASGTLCP